MNSDYVFVSRWTVARSREALWDALEGLLDTSDPMIWWPSVQVNSYDGETMAVRASSGLGYALTFSLTDLETRRPHTLSFAASGDLRGRGTVSFVELGPRACAMDIDWQVSTDRRWMQWTAWVLRPVFVAGHHLVMRQGRKHFSRWLEERESPGGSDVV